MVTMLMQRRLQNAAVILCHQLSVLLGPKNVQFIGRAHHSSSEEMAVRALESFILALESKALYKAFFACALVKPLSLHSSGLCLVQLSWSGHQ